MKRCFYHALIISATIGWAAEATPLTWDSLLGSVSKDPKFQASTERTSLLQKPIGRGVWKKAELRYEADGLDLREHKFAARVVPLAWGEREATQTEWGARRELNQILRDEALADALQERYNLGAEYLYRLRQYQYHQALHQVYQDRVKVHLQKTDSDKFDPEDLVLSEQMVVTLEGDMLGDQNSLEELDGSLHHLIEDWTVVSLDTTNMLSVQEISNHLDSLAQLSDTAYLPIREAKLRMDLVKSRNSLDAVSSNAVLSYVETGYDLQIPAAGKRDKTSAIQDLSVGVGISIPFGDGRKQDELRRSLAQVDSKTAYLQAVQDLSTKVQSLRMEIGSMLRQKAVLDSFSTRVNAGALFTDYARRAGSDPLLLLRAQASSLDASWRSEKLRFEIYLSYVRLLEITGELARDPGRNHLKRLPNG